MSSKRSRLMRSTSTGQIDLYSTLPDHHTQWQKWYPPFKKLRSVVGHSQLQHQKGVIFTLNSALDFPVVSEVVERDQNCNFLDRCYYCNEELPMDGPVFMYRDFGAFCKAECREKQVALDGGDIDVVKLKNNHDVQQRVSGKAPYLRPFITHHRIARAS